MPSGVDVVVRFGGDVIAITRVERRAYRIGTAKGVDLALDIAPLTAFPLVDATGAEPVIRCPAGVPAIVRDARGERRVGETELQLPAGAKVELRFGKVAIELERAEPAPAVPSPPADRRPVPYAAGSLVVHLAVWATAMALATPMRQAKRPREMRRVRVSWKATTTTKPHPNPYPNPNPSPSPIPKPRSARSAPRPHRNPAVQAALDQTIVGEGRGAQIADALSALVAVEAGAVQKVNQAGPLYDPDAVAARGFGGAGGHFDPELGVALCGAGCAVTGPLGHVVVEHGLDSKREELVACAADAPGGGEVLLDLEIAADGSVQSASASGLGAAGPCIAAVARGIAFPPDSAPTHASVPIRFVAR